MSATFMIAAVGSYVGGCSRKNGARGDREGGREGGSEESVEGYRNFFCITGKGHLPWHTITWVKKRPRYAS